MPLNELAATERIAGVNSVLRKLRSGCVHKVFVAKDADAHLTRDIVIMAEAASVPVEWVEESLKLGRACAVSRKTAAAALLKK